MPTEKSQERDSYGWQHVPINHNNRPFFRRNYDVYCENQIVIVIDLKATACSLGLACELSAGLRFAVCMQQLKK